MKNLILVYLVWCMAHWALIAFNKFTEGVSTAAVQVQAARQNAEVRKVLANE